MAFSLFPAVFMAHSLLPAMSLRIRGGLLARGILTGVRRSAMSKNSKSTKSSTYIVIEDISSDGWKLAGAIQILKEGGLGILPTDTAYMYVTSVNSRPGVERIYALKNPDQNLKKPLSLLCSSISQISQYTTAMNSKRYFKMLKELLPGPYTFIFPATNELPRMVLEHKGHLKTWKRKEIGVRMPDSPVVQAVLADLSVPLLCATVALVNADGSPIADPARHSPSL